MMKNDRRAVNFIEEIKKERSPKADSPRPDYSARDAAQYLGISRRIFNRMIKLLNLKPDITILEQEKDGWQYPGRPSNRYRHAVIEELKTQIDSHSDDKEGGAA